MKEYAFHAWSFHKRNTGEVRYDKEKKMKKKLGLAIILLCAMVLLTFGVATAEYSCYNCWSTNLTLMTILQYGGEGVNNSPDYHCYLYRCNNCSRSVWFDEGHTGGTATCTQKPVCSVCGATYGSALGHVEVVDPEIPANCTETGLTEGKHCSVCREPLIAQQVIPATGHDYSSIITPPTCTEDGYTTYTCTGCGDTYTDTITAATGHDYKLTIARPECTKGGYTTSTCGTCGDAYRSNYTDRLLHWFDLWTPNGDGTHSAECKREGCKHVGTVECAYCDLNYGGSIYRVCQVCGGFKDTTFEPLSGVTCEAIDNGAIPRGELIVRGMANPFGNTAADTAGLSLDNAHVTYAFTAAPEYAGKVEPFGGTVRISLPLDGIEGFKLVRAGEVESVETPYVLENGILTFETDATGLFLLLSNSQ
jgi:hypothetical protein